MVSIFPSTTPAALMSLATAVWPGQHGAPGWDLRDHRNCEYPSNFGHTELVGPVHLRILYPFIVDSRSGKSAKALGYTDDEVFASQPVTSLGPSDRRLLYVSAYQEGDFCKWSECRECLAEAPDISALIPETDHHDIGSAKGSMGAVDFFAAGVDRVLEGVSTADRAGEKTYTYFYTAHPDKHMHQLGVEHAEVGSIMRGLDTHIKRLWHGLEQLDVTLIVTADHGHVTVAPSEMVVLPADVEECLEYANVGVHGKGRHAYLHCKVGRRADLEERWARHAVLRDAFLLLDVDDAVSEGLFGPEPMKLEVRPRLGDFVAMSVNPKTLVTAGEAAAHHDKPQGAHGSLLPDEMRIPFILCTSCGTSKAT